MGEEEATTDTEVSNPRSWDAMVKLEDSQKGYSEFKMMLSYLPDDIAAAIKAHPIRRRDMMSINSSLQSIQSGIWATLPMRCAGERCPYGDRCPVQAQGIPPVGADCPLELYMMHTWIDQYCDALAVNVKNKVEMDQVTTVVMCDLMIHRAQNWMAQRPDGHVETNATGIDKHGNVVFARDISKEILIQEKYDKIKQRHLESLLATREAKAKYDVIDETDPSVAAVKLRGKGQEILERAKDRKDAMDEKAEVLEDRGKAAEKARVMEDILTELGE